MHSHAERGNETQTALPQERVQPGRQAPDTGQFVHREGYQLDPPDAPRQGLADPRHEPELLRAGQHEIPHAPPGVDPALEIRHQVRTPLHLVDHRAIRIAGEKAARVRLRQFICKKRAGAGGAETDGSRAQAPRGSHSHAPRGSHSHAPRGSRSHAPRGNASRDAPRPESLTTRDRPPRAQPRPNRPAHSPTATAPAGPHNSAAPDGTGHEVGLIRLGDLVAAAAHGVPRAGGGSRVLRRTRDAERPGGIPTRSVGTRAPRGVGRGRRGAQGVPGTRRGTRAPASGRFTQ